MPSVAKDTFEGVVEFFGHNDLCILQADKIGGFIAFPKTMSHEKAVETIKNFFPVGNARVKSKAVELCNRLDMVKLARDIWLSLQEFKCC